MNGHAATQRPASATSKGIEQAISCYQQNWLAVSGQKLFSNSLSHYLHSLCPHQTSVDLASTDDSSLVTCKCHSNYLVSYLEYLNDARFAIEQCRYSTKLWKNAYVEPCFSLADVHEQSIIFCAVNDHLNNNDDCSGSGSHSDEESRAINEFVIESSGHKKNGRGIDGQQQPQTMKSVQYDEQRRPIDYSVGVGGVANGIAMDVVAMIDGCQLNPPVIGLFLETVLSRVAQFFENDVLTNLHLTGLLTALSQSPHKLLLSLFFDETLARQRGVPCLLHLLQNLSLEAQSAVDDIPNFESMFQSAKINLQSVPIGELNCQLLTGNHRQNRTRTYSTTSLSKSMGIEGLSTGELTILLTLNDSFSFSQLH